MANAKTKKSVKPLPKKIISGVSALIMLVLIVVLSSNSIKELVATAQLKQELKSVQSELDTLKLENESLSMEKSKLSDPAYVENFARGTHLLSKDDDQVFILPKSKP